MTDDRAPMSEDEFAAYCRTIAANPNRGGHLRAPQRRGAA